MRANRIDEWAGRFLCGFVRLISGAAARWVDCEPSTRQRIYYGNHASHLDIAVLWASLPPEVRLLTRPVAARDYWETSRIKQYLAHRVLNAIMIDRAGHGAGFSAAQRSVEATVSGMGSCNSLIIFPEGTRGAGEEIAPFKSGLYHIARKVPGVELVPVYMENLNRILPKGETLLVPFVSSISFGQPLVINDGENKSAFLLRARQALLTLAET